MKIKTVAISNFRRLTTLQLDLAGESAFLIAENAGGKTSALVAVARALGRDLGFSYVDFADAAAPIEIVVTLYDLSLDDQATFAERVEFGQEVTLQVGVRAIWDPTSEQVEISHGYARHAWARSTRQERDALPLIWLPAWRDPSRLLGFGTTTGLLSPLIDRLPLTTPLRQALDEIEAGARTFGGDATLRGLLDEGGAILRELIPNVAASPFDLGIGATTERELLKQFELLLSYGSPPIPVPHQSSGLGQLSVFVFARRLLDATPGALVLIDEPEISLHPHAQRALVNLVHASSAQSVIATHSSNILDRVDPRTVIRLHESGGGLQAARPTSLTDDEARRLARLSTPQTAEAFFARKVVLVEGISDILAVRALAERQGRNLDAEGVSLLSLEGGGGFEAYVSLLGRSGLGLELLGLCDSDEEAQWATWLENAGYGHGLDRQAMEALGFFVSDRDLEDELIRAVGIGAVLNIIKAEGDAAAFQAFTKQAPHAALSQEDQIRAFFRKRGRKARYASVLVDACTPGSEPQPLLDLLVHA